MHNLRYYLRLVEDVATDLPMDKASRLARAKLLGFDTSRVWYHGTRGRQIDAFDLNRRGQNTNARSATRGFFFTSDPSLAQGYGGHHLYMPDDSRPAYDGYAARILVLDQEIEELADTLWTPRGRELDALEQKFYYGPRKKRPPADAYYQAKTAIEQKYNTPENHDLQARWQERWNERQMLRDRMHGMKTMAAISTAVIHPVYLQMARPLVYDMKGAMYRELSYNDVLTKARRGRRDGVIIRNTYDPGFRGADNPQCDIAVVFQPAQIRATHAVFDPAHADSGDLLA